MLSLADGVLCCGVQGHFQIVLSRRHSPLLIRGLSPFMRILYCSGVWSYVVGAITTPLFIIIPLLTIWAGIFPIVTSWWAALALTIYYIAQSLVLNYSKKVSALACCARCALQPGCCAFKVCLTIYYIAQSMMLNYSKKASSLACYACCTSATRLLCFKSLPAV